jgi:hypothetical protein
MGGWCRSPAYLIWVIGGLVVIIGVTVALGLSNPTDQRDIFAILPMLAVYMGGIFVMQARAARRAAIGESAQEPVPEPASARTDVLLRPATHPRRCGTRWPRSSPPPGGVASRWRRGTTASS